MKQTTKRQTVLLDKRRQRKLAALCRWGETDASAVIREAIDALHARRLNERDEHLARYTLAAESRCSCAVHDTLGSLTPAPAGVQPEPRENGGGEVADG